jgi:hypothetical protein
VLRRLTLLTAAVLSASAAPAIGAPDRGPQWATLNMCSPSAVGARASVPGDGSAARELVRFTLQWATPTSGWVPVEGQPTSPWLPAGSARYVSGQAGWTFALRPPPAGTRFTLRAVAELEWTNRGEVVRRRTLVTASGLSGVAEGQPLGTSLATCTVG